MARYHTFNRAFILLVALALAGCAGCKAAGGNGGGGSAPVTNINQNYNEDAKMPQVTPSWK